MCNRNIEGDGDDELPSINPNLFDFFQWLKDIKSITTCWL